MEFKIYAAEVETLCGLPSARFERESAEVIWLTARTESSSADFRGVGDVIPFP